MSHRSVGIRHFAWNPEPEFTAKYRGIPAFPVISTGNLQRSNRVADRAVCGCRVSRAALLLAGYACGLARLDP